MGRCAATCAAAPAAQLKNRWRSGSDTNSQNSGATKRGKSKKSALPVFPGSIRVAALLFPKLSLFCVFRVLND